MYLRGLYFGIGALGLIFGVLAGSHSVEIISTIVFYISMTIGVTTMVGRDPTKPSLISWSIESAKGLPNEGSVSTVLHDYAKGNDIWGYELEDLIDTAMQEEELRYDHITPGMITAEKINFGQLYL